MGNSPQWFVPLGGGSRLRGNGHAILGLLPILNNGKQSSKLFRSYSGGLGENSSFLVQS